MKRTLPLLLALSLALSSCEQLQSIVEQHETAVYIPVETQVTDTLFSWENETEAEADPIPETKPEEPSPTPSQGEPAGEEDLGDPEKAEPGDGESEETEAGETGETGEETEEPDVPEVVENPEGPGTTPWISLTAGEDEARDGLFTRAGAALLTEQIVRCCVNRTWLDVTAKGPKGYDEEAVSNFYISTLKYRELEAYPDYFRDLVSRNETEGNYTVDSTKAGEISSRFFLGGSLAAGNRRYTADSEGFPVSFYSLTGLTLSSDSVSVTARFHLTDAVREDPGAPLSDYGEYRIIFYKAGDGGLPKMLFAKTGDAEPEDSSDPPMPDEAGEWNVPDFLTEEQADLWRRARVLSGAFFSTDSFAESYPRKDGAPFIPGTLYADGDGWYACRGRWSNYYDFEAMMASVFSWSYWQDLKENHYRNENGRLWAGDGVLPGRVGYLPDRDRFELISSNDWTVDLWYYASYALKLGEEDGPVETERYRITFVNSDLGWRLSSFAYPPMGYLRAAVPESDRETTHPVTAAGAAALTEQLVRWVMPASWMEGTPVFTNEDALRFLYSLTLYAEDAPEHPYVRYVRRADDRGRYEIAEADARRIVRELFGLDSLTIPDGAFDSVAGCVWIPLRTELPNTPYDVGERTVGDDGSVVLAHVVGSTLYPSGEFEDYGEWNFSYRRASFGSPLFSLVREG